MTLVADEKCVLIVKLPLVLKKGRGLYLYVLLRLWKHTARNELGRVGSGRGRDRPLLNQPRRRRRKSSAGR